MCLDPLFFPSIAIPTYINDEHMCFLRVLFRVILFSLILGQRRLGDLVSGKFELIKLRVKHVQGNILAKKPLTSPKKN